MEAPELRASIVGGPAETGAGLSRNIAKGAAVESELNGLITRRHDARVAEEGKRPAEELWKASERRHEVRRRAENEAAWCRYHQDQAERHRRTLEALIRGHEEAAARLGGAA